MSNNGWTDDFLCTEWFPESFIPQASAKNTSGAPILLIYDSHGSHTTMRCTNLQRSTISSCSVYCHTQHIACSPWMLAFLALYNADGRSAVTRYSKLLMKR